MPQPVRRRLRSLDSEGHGIDKLVFEVDAIEGFCAEAFILVGPDGQPIGTATNPLNVAGGGGGASGPLDVTDRLARLLGHVLVDNWPASQPVEGPLTEAQLRALAVAVSGPLTDAQLRGSPVPINGTTAVSNFPATQPVSGPLTDTQLRAGPVIVQDKTANTLGVTATGVAAAAVTATLPPPGAGQFQYIEAIEITMYSTAARTGSATPVLVTSTNLPGNPSWTFPSAGAIGTTVTMLLQPRDPIRAAAANTPVTIVCPATTAVIWRVNAFYGVGS